VWLGLCVWTTFASPSMSCKYLSCGEIRAFFGESEGEKKTQK
jgi:hypothetical protein